MQQPPLEDKGKLAEAAPVPTKTEAEPAPALAKVEAPEAPSLPKIEAELASTLNKVQAEAAPVKADSPDTDKVVKAALAKASQPVSDAIFPAATAPVPPKAEAAIQSGTQSLSNDKYPLDGGLNAQKYKTVVIGKTKGNKTILQKKRLHDHSVKSVS